MALLFGWAHITVVIRSTSHWHVSVLIAPQNLPHGDCNIRPEVVKHAELLADWYTAGRGIPPGPLVVVHPHCLLLTAPDTDSKENLIRPKKITFEKP